LKKARIVRRGLAVLVLVYAGWLALQVVLYRRYVASAPPDAVPAAETTRYWEAEGVYHVHTRFSDGRRAADDVAAIGAKAGLDFVILTDHGAPNEASLAAQGRKSGILLLAGCEISSSRGHLAALGFATPTRPFSPEAEMAAREVAALGGFTIIAHPYSKTHWSWGEWAGYGGIEIFNGDTTVKRRLVRTVLSLPVLLVRPEAALLRLLAPPVAETGKWDRLAVAHPLYAYFAADAHFAYGALFTLFHLHVLLDAPPAPAFEDARRQIFSALKAGRFYNAVEAAAAARGFRFWAEKEGAILPMGCVAPPAPAGSGPVRFVVRTPFAFAHETRLLRDGAEVARSAGTELVFETAERGVFRAEVFLRERSPLDPRAPWIVSNPIFLERSGR
jgi:hypothetical protein